MPRYSIVLGRTLADSTTNAWSILATAVFGFLFGFRIGGTVPDSLAAFGLCLIYGIVFTVVFIVIGLWTTMIGVDFARQGKRDQR